MLRYELQKVMGSAMHYAYFPEKTGQAGVVVLDGKSGEARVAKVSSDDIGTRYAYKLIDRLETLHAQNALKNAGTVAWY